MGGRWRHGCASRWCSICARPTSRLAGREPRSRPSFTAAALGRAAVRLPRPPASFIVAGGGARNPTLMRMITEQLAPAQVESADAVGWSAHALEAQAFAFLAVRTLRGLPITFPDTTGAPRPMTGGVVVQL